GDDRVVMELLIQHRQALRLTPRGGGPDHPSGVRHSRAAAVVTVVAVGIAVGCGSGGGPERPMPTSPSASATLSAPSTATPSATGASQPPATPGLTAPTAGTPVRPPGTTAGSQQPTAEQAAVLRPGTTGSQVHALQRRLDQLGYPVGLPDGTYGTQTTQAVLALQKAAGLGSDGVVGPRTRSALDRGVLPRPRTRSGSVVEVDLEHQLVLVVQDGRLVAVFNTSTGNGQPYTVDGVTTVATTPRGRFAVQREIDGLRVSRLGELWRPKYFTGGYALHGSPSVPGYPASHGCVRLSTVAINLLWSRGWAPVGRAVWVY
ncbi:MAG: peptidoglycan-binding protein, partial [Angustibacter sp.]